MESVNLIKSKQLGKGAYGRVYEVLIPENNQSVALKANFVEPSLNGSIGALRELDILHKVSEHPLCIGLKFIAPKEPFLNGSMSPTLSDKVTDRFNFVLEKGVIDGDKFIHKCNHGYSDRKLFMLHVLLGLEYLHSRNIYHRDLKPANIICFFDANQNLEAAKITDFGLASYYNKQIIAPSKMVTLWYRAPEILFQQEVGLKSDIWSLGVMFIELMTRVIVVCNSDEKSTANNILSKFEFSQINRQLAGMIYPPFFCTTYKSMSKIQNLINTNGFSIDMFNNDQKYGGNYEEFTDLISKMLKVSPDERYTASDCLNHPFFKNCKQYIDRYRDMFYISQKGVWVTKTSNLIKYSDSLIRSEGIELFRKIYNDRTNAVFSVWYTHLILFHAVEMFDRYLVLEPPRCQLPTGLINIWVNTFLFMSAKYFRVLLPTIGMDLFMFNIPKNFKYSIVETMAAFEEHVVINIFKINIYQQTIYEEFEEYASEIGIRLALKYIIEKKFEGKTLRQFFLSIKNEIEKIQRVVPCFEAVIDL